MSPTQIQILIGAIGALIAVVGGAIVAHHRTRGARRRLAAEATSQALELLKESDSIINDPIRLQAELFVYYYEVIVAAESRPRLRNTTISDVLKRFYPRHAPEPSKGEMNDPCPRSVSWWLRSEAQPTAAGRELETC